MVMSVKANLRCLRWKIGGSSYSLKSYCEGSVVERASWGFIALHISLVQVVIPKVVLSKFTTRIIRVNDCSSSMLSCSDAKRRVNRCFIFDFCSMPLTLPVAARSYYRCFFVVQPDSGRSQMGKLIDSGAVDGCCWLSCGLVQKLTDIGTVMLDQARMMSQAMRKLSAFINKQKQLLSSQPTKSWYYVW